MNHLVIQEKIDFRKEQKNTFIVKDKFEKVLIYKKKICLFI
jgi:hypothetical protein